MIKHIGRHGQKKIVIIYRKVPGEDHMALVVYSDLLPRIYHDTLMTVVESESGQQTVDLADVLFRNYMPDGTNCLHALHNQGLIKKVQTSQIVVTPNRNSSVRLDELNNLLDEMSKGKAAIEKLSEIEKNRNLPENSLTETTSIPNQPGALTDQDLAIQRLKQAEAMRADAERLLREADALQSEAAKLDPTVIKNDSVTKKKSVSKVKKG